MEFDYLCHHGVKGQKWGVRRFQDRNGSLTPAGRKRYAMSRTYRYVQKTSDDIQSIVDTMSTQEKQLMGLDDGTYMHDDAAYVAKRFIKRVGGEPVAFLDIYDYGQPGVGNVTVGTRSDSRHRGYAADLMERGKQWINDSTESGSIGINTLTWWAHNENLGSKALAIRSGFKEDPDSDYPDWWHGIYKKSTRNI